MPDTLQQDTYATNMAFVAQAVAYNQYLVDGTRRFLGDRVLDVGCGIGNTTALLGRPYVVGLEPTDSYLTQFRRNLPDTPVIQDDISAPRDLDGLRAHAFDTIFSSNVLEHIEDDRAALANMHEILVEGGRLVLLVPQYAWLYGSMDAEDLHFRRYSQKVLVERATEAGFRVERTFSLNVPGILWWFVSGKLLRRGIGDESEAGLINKVIPVVRWIDRLCGHRIGLSLVLVAQK